LLVHATFISGVILRTHLIRGEMHIHCHTSKEVATQSKPQQVVEFLLGLDTICFYPHYELFSLFFSDVYYADAT